VNDSKIIHYLSFTDCNSKKDIVENSVANTDLAIHNVKEFKYFFELVLYNSIVVKILSWLEIFKQLYHINSKLFFVHMWHYYFIVQFIPTDMLKFVNKIFKQIINENLLSDCLWQFTHKPHVCFSCEGTKLIC
jgi:hypothetical protein